MFEDSVPDSVLDLGGCAVTFFWNGATDSVSGESDVHVLCTGVNYWGLMTSLRCASQSSTFDLSGSQIEPVIDAPPPFEPYYVIRNMSNARQQSLEQPKSEGIPNLRAAVGSGELVAFAKGVLRALGKIMHRPAFNELVLEHIGGLEIISYTIRKSHQLILKASGEKDDEYWHNQAMYQLECQRMEEMENRWMESDMEKVILSSHRCLTTSSCLHSI